MMMATQSHRPLGDGYRRALAASVIQLGISRTREYMADEEGGRMIDDPIALARP